MTFTIPAGAMFFAFGWAAGWGFLAVVAHATRGKRGAK